MAGADALGLEANRRLRHERRIIARLAGVEGVAGLSGVEQEAAAPQEPRVPSLAQVLTAGPLPVPLLLELALHLARTLGAMHRRGVVHHNISPAHILLHGPGHSTLLTGFELATTLAEERPGFIHHREIRGDLTYLAPERTGRTGRSVDLRADLYSLGATLYEAATGRPPFESRDPLQLLHDHLARVPVAPRQLRVDLPDTLSRIILRLLEKEPERRYQSAEGLMHDLVRVEQALGQGGEAQIHLGEQDFPLQLSAPARLVGRGAEISALRLALEASVQGHASLVLVSGAPGVGKTALINELRPMVTARRGWFVSGKFDQYRHDAPTAPMQAFRALGRLLLAEPEEGLASQRERILRALGTNAGLMCNIPEFALLLGPQPNVAHADPAQAEARLLATAVNLLRPIVSPERPVVMILDDLQWAGALSVRFMEAVLDASALPGLLVVGSYRAADVDATHPLAVALARWNRLARPPVQLGLANLPAKDLGDLLGEMMRLPALQAAALAQAVDEHTGGNPYDTVELLNALRQGGALRPGPGGWEWDAQTLRRYVGHSGVLDLLAARIARLPAQSQALLHAIACLGGQVPMRLLCAATGLTAAELDEQLAAPLEDGLLTAQPDEDSVLRMRHDRVQQAVHGSLAAAHRRAVHLGLARRLAATTEFGTAAVQQYLLALQDIADPLECRRAARLFHEVAVRTGSVANYAVAQRMLAAALELLSRLPSPDARDQALRAALEIDHHLALCSLGRFEEADALYRVIEGRGAPVEDWVMAACAQVRSLHSRSRTRDAVTLGLSLLRQLGLDVPADFAAVDIERRLAHMGQWINQADPGVDPRPYTGDRRSTATVRLLNQVGYAAFYSDLKVLGWLLLECDALWVRYGPSPELAQILGAISIVAIGVAQDYRAAYEAASHVVGVAEARGWEPATSEARFLLANHASHWFEPLENGVRQLHLARDCMLGNGELQIACFSHRPSSIAMLDCAATLQVWEQEVESGLTLALRTRNDYVVAMNSLELQLLRGLRGEADFPDGLADDVQTFLQRLASQAQVSLTLHFCHALLAAMSGNMPALVRHAAHAMEYVPLTQSSYRTAQARLLQALALARQAKIADPAGRAVLLAELDALCEWMQKRAADAPANFLHLSSWMQAERAWAVDDFRSAVAHFDAAVCQAESVTRPWHHAMIRERAGLFYLEHGMHGHGQHFIARARLLYQAWGAQAKVRQLESTHAFLAADRVRLPEPTRVDGAPAPVDTIDTLAILRASQALSGETSLARLKTRVADVMGALTGATAIRFALWDEDLKDWFLSEGEGPQAARITASDAGALGLLPLSAFRYAERTREPLLVDDATGDDRFARDPYLAGLAHCSLLVVPILNQGSLRAMLLLENRLSRGAFSSGRLDAVSLIAGQLAVSLENALLYDRLEQRVRDQTRELVATARRAGMAQIATNVLHNVGNVLNSVNVSTRVLRAQIRQSRAGRVSDLAGLLQGNAGDLGRFFAEDERGRMLPGYMRELAQALAGEREQLLAELTQLDASVEHIKNVVAMQQSHAGGGGMLEAARMTDLADDALRLQQDSLARHGVTVERDYAPVEAIALDRTRVMQILVNLIENARQAMDAVPGTRRLGLAVRLADGRVRVDVSDNGCGIPADNLTRIFSHGFTTKPGGHGFGLHSCAVAAMEMDGTLTVASEGAGSGCTFTLELKADAAALGDAASREGGPANPGPLPA